MGAKTALLAFSDGDLRSALLGATRCDPAEAEDLVRRLMPGYDVTPSGAGGNLSEDANPGFDTAFATVLAGAEIICDGRLVAVLPSELPAHLLEAGAGRRILLHQMHSFSDSLTFAVWENRVLVRSLAMSPDDGIAENIGEPFDFERPYWAGEHPMESYPLPFHPLELGEEALRALFGFVIEGRPDPDDIDGYGVHLHGFHVRDPTGREQEARDAALRQWMSARRTTHRIGTDGQLR